MMNLQIVNNVDHKDVRVIQDVGGAYGDQIHSCPAYTFEFRDLQGDFPILLQDDGEGGHIPVALMGFQDGENLFVEQGRWTAMSKPAFMRKGPFLIGQHTGNDNEPVRLLSIDRNHPRISETEGEPLFQPLGGRTDYLEQMADLLETIYEGAQHSQAYAQALADLELIESVTLDITLRDGSRNQLLGFYTVNEDKVRALTGEQLAALAEAGHLMPLFMMLASMVNFRRLIELKEQAQASAQ